MIVLKSKDWNLRFHSKKSLDSEQRKWMEISKKGLEDIMCKYAPALEAAGLKVRLDVFTVPALSVDDLIKHKAAGRYILFESNYLTVWRRKDDPAGPIGMVDEERCAHEIGLLKEHFDPNDLEIWLGHTQPGD